MKLDPALRQAGPLLVSTLVYRLCSVGLSLLPALAVDRGLGTGQASLLLGATRTAAFAGGLVGGALVDRLGLKPPLLLGLLGAAVGIGLTAVDGPFALLLLAAPLGALGHGVYQPTMRMMLGAVVEPARQQVAVGWLRTVTNLASLTGFALTAAAASIGLGPLFLVDAFTSLVALLIARRSLPDARQVQRRAAPLVSAADGDPMDDPAGRRAFLLFSALMLGNMFLYELYGAATAGALRRVDPEGGVRVYGLLMVLNTLVCAAVGVPAARRLRNPAVQVPVGLALQTAGLLVTARDFTDTSAVVLGMVLLTAGEVAITSVSGYALLVLSPRGPHAGKLFGLNGMAMDAGRMLGAVAAFPLLIAPDPASGTLPGRVLVGVTGCLLVVAAVAARPVWRVFRDRA